MAGAAILHSPWEPPPGSTARLRVYVIAAACAGGLAFGALLPAAPRTAVCVLLVVPLALAAPVEALAALVGTTVLVPFDMQDRLKIIGGHGQPGLLLVDALMLLGLARIGWLVARRRLAVDLRLVAGTTMGLVCAAALIWGLARGAAVSEAGHEARRVVLAVGAFLLAWPLMGDPGARRRLAGALLAIGLALGLWGLAQWMFSVPYTLQGDVGVRPGLDLRSSGFAQLQGGLYAYPVAVTVAWAALVAGQLRSAAARALVVAVLSLNAVCVMLTYERTFWVVTVGACAAVVAGCGASARIGAIRWAGLGVAAVPGLAVIAPGLAGHAWQRVVSIARVSTDNSLTARMVESHAVAGAVAPRPLTGSGFGSTVTWGSRTEFATITTSFSHNGYLWLAWKIGIPAAVFVVLILGRAVLRPAPAGDDPQWRALRIGSRAAVGALLLVCVMFPVINALGITATIGVLVAVCYSGPSPPPDRSLR